MLEAPILAPARHAAEIDVADLFAGAGGADEAFRQIVEELGIRVRGHWVVNHWDAACDTQVANNPGAVLITGDRVPVEVPVDGYVVIHDAMENVAASLIAPGRKLTLLIMAPPCTHFSKARGGKPKDEQQRGTVNMGWEVVDDKQPDVVITENVEDFRTWGPLDANGKVIKERKGEFYDQWKAGWRARGYEYDDAILNSANFGGLTSRSRFFGIARRDGKPITFPKQTHSKGGKVPGTKPWRAAAEAIDFRKTGEDVWERARPLAPNTIGRIAHGFARKGPMWKPLAESLRAYERNYRRMYANMADIMEGLGLDEVKVKKRQGKTLITVGPSTFAGSLAAVETHRIVRRLPDTGPVPIVKMLEVASSREEVEQLVLHLEEQALVTSNDRPQTNRSLAHEPTEPMPTVTGNDRIMVANPQLTMSGPGGGVPRDVALPHATFTGGGAAWIILSALILPWEGALGGKERRDEGRGNLARAVEDVFQTFTQRGAGHLVSAILELAQGALITPGHGEHDKQQPRVMDASEKPSWTMAQNGAGLLSLSRFLVEYYTHGRTVDADEAPMPPVTTHDQFALAQAILLRGKVTAHTRMVDVPELAVGMGFGRNFVFTGTETEQKKQIGNAWEINVGKALFREILTSLDGVSA